MSDRDQEIINSLRHAYEAFSRADFDTAIEIAHPDVEFVLPNKVLVRQHTWGRGAGSGVGAAQDGCCY